jgi:hypothetical protein
MTYIGNLEALRIAMQRNPAVRDITAEEGCPLVYLATRSGYCDIIQLLFRFGADVNAKGNGSSALHAAAYFGQSRIVEFLIGHGASLTFRNRMNNLSFEEASTQVIKDLILNANDDKAASLLRELANLGLSRGVETIVHKGEIVGYRVLRRIEQQSTITANWKVGWHGTTSISAVSIFKHGLKKPGDVTDGIVITERANHIQPGLKVGDIEDWSRAVFISPVLTYAAHPAYATRIASKPGSGEWCILVHAYARPGSFTTCPSTLVGTYVKKEGSDEPEEMRVEAGEDEKVVNKQANVEIVRVPDTTNVTVLAIVLANDKFIQETTLPAIVLSRLMQGSDLQ